MQLSGRVCQTQIIANKNRILDRTYKIKWVREGLWEESWKGKGFATRGMGRKHQEWSGNARRPRCLAGVGYTADDLGRGTSKNTDSVPL